MQFAIRVTLRDGTQQTFKLASDDRESAERALAPFQAVRSALRVELVSTQHDAGA